VLVGGAAWFLVFFPPKALPQQFAPAVIVTLLVVYLFWSQLIRLGEMPATHADFLKRLARRFLESIDLTQAVSYGTDRHRAASDRLAFAAHFRTAMHELDLWDALMAERDAAYGALDRKRAEIVSATTVGRTLVDAQVAGALRRQAEGLLSSPQVLPSFQIWEGPIPGVGRGLWLGGSALAGFPDDAPDGRLQETQAAFETAVGEVETWPELGPIREVGRKIAHLRERLRPRLIAIETSQRLGGTCPQCR
jgi:hypothetical protein